MAKYEAGKEVLSYCGKCKLALAHVIVSMKDASSFGKVQCKTCNATHAYKDPATKTKKVKSKRSTSTKRKSVSVGELWTEELGKSDGNAKSYGIREIFEVGDLLDHKKFGPGIVQALVDGKIEVLFQHEIKTLVHGIK